MPLTSHHLSICCYRQLLKSAGYAAIEGDDFQIAVLLNWLENKKHTKNYLSSAANSI